MSPKDLGNPGFLNPGLNPEYLCCLTVCLCCAVSSDCAGVPLPHHGSAGVLLPLRPAAERLPRRLQTEHQRQRVDTQRQRGIPKHIH